MSSGGTSTQTPAGSSGTGKTGGSPGSGGTTGETGGGGSGEYGSSSGGGASAGTGGTNPSSGSGGSAGTDDGAGGLATGGGGAPSAGAGGGAGANQGGRSAGDLLLFDDFEDGEFEGPAPLQTWINADPANGNWSVSSQLGSLAYVGNATSSEVLLSAAGDIRWTDQRVEAKVATLEGTPTLLLMGRFTGLRDYISLEFRPDAGDLRVRLKSNGSTSTVCRARPAPVPAGLWSTLGFSVRGGAGSELILTLNGAEVAAESACVLPGSTPMRGAVAVGVSEGIAAFDEIRVTVAGDTP